MAKAYCVCDTYAIKHFMHLIIIIIHKYISHPIQFSSRTECCVAIEQQCVTARE